MLKAQHVIWDWNGTLIDDIPLALSVINEIRQLYNLHQMDVEMFRDLYQHPIFKMYLAMGFQIDLETFKTLSGTWNQRYRERFSEVELHHSAVAVLSKLASRNVNQHILSAHHHERLLEDVAQFNLTDYFQSITGLNVSTADSKVENGKELLRKLQANSNEVLLVGDSSHDYEVAAELGCNCVLMAHGAESKKRLSRHSAVVLENFSELADYLSL